LHALHDVKILGFFTLDGVWWVRFREGAVECNAVMTAGAFNHILCGTHELCYLFQFVTSDGIVVRVIALDYESDALKKLLQVPPEEGL
jgi:hypothetical protein